MVGIPRLLSSLSTFSGVSFFGMDEMHLIARGIGKLVYLLLDPTSSSKFKGSNSDRYTFQFRPRTNGRITMKNIGQLIVQSRPRVPASFEGSWDDRFDLYRAVDWQDLLTVIVPTVIVPHLSSEVAKVRLMNLVNGCIIALQRSVTAADLIKLKQ